MTDRPRVVVSHATGNRNVRELLAALVSEEMLDGFFTTTGRIGEMSDRPGFARLARLVNRRTFPMLQDAQLHTHPGREIIRKAVGAVPLKRVRRLTATSSAFGIHWVATGLDRHVAKSLSADADIVYGYLGQSAHTFAKAKALGLSTVLEAHHATMRTTLRIVQAEKERNPEWAGTLSLEGLQRHSDAGERDIQLADLIVSPSSQVTESVIETSPSARVLAIPYGSPDVESDAAPLSWDGRGPLRLLFVGRVQGIKGIADLAEIVKRLGPRVELSIVGALPAEIPPPLARLIDDANYLGVMSREEVLGRMRAAHLLVLPSLVEGRSLAVLEALSVGLPAVVTPGTGTDDVVGKGGGIVVPIASPDDLVAAVESVLAEPARVRAMSEAALTTARSASWDSYRREVIAALASVVEASNPHG